MKSFDTFITEYSEYSLAWKLRSAYFAGFLACKFEKELEQFLEKHPIVSLDIGTSGISCNCTSREMLLDFLKIFGGSWVKKVNDYQPHLIDYSQTVVLGEHIAVQLVVSAAPPPPSCHIEEVEEEIPAHTRKVKKLVCKNTEQVLEEPTPVTDEDI
jgi:hypothetical protein